MQEITRIDPLSTAKATALLGVLWALLGWVFSGFMILLIIRGNPEAASTYPPAFSIWSFASSILGGFIGGAVSGYLGSHVYNLLADRIGGIRVELRNSAVPTKNPV